jgi:hypothetical protein
MQTRKKDGIPLPENLYVELNGLAGELGTGVVLTKIR